MGFAHAAGFAAARRCLRFLVRSWYSCEPKGSHRYHARTIPIGIRWFVRSFVIAGSASAYSGPQRGDHQCTCPGERTGIGWCVRVCAHTARKTTHAALPRCTDGDQHVMDGHMWESCLPIVGVFVGLPSAVEGEVVQMSSADNARTMPFESINYWTLAAWSVILRR